MKDLTVVNIDSMTSLEIAELTGKRHDHVCRDLRKLEEDGVIALHSFGETEKDSQNKSRTVYKLPKRETLILTSGYSAKQRASIIDRWLELEVSAISKSKLSLLPADIAKSTFFSMMEIAEYAQIPKSYAMQETAKIVSKESGIDLTKLLTQAAVMTNVPEADIMLEPTELGELFDFSAVKMNKELATLGLQVKEGGKWTATELGRKISQQHAWVSGTKSGYNLKWLAKEIESLLNTQSALCREKGWRIANAKEGKLFDYLKLPKNSYCQSH